VKRDWKRAVAKVRKEGRCRVCKRPAGVEAAHTTGRENDEPGDDARVLLVNPDSIVPLCGPATDTRTCHGRYDAHRLDLLPYLSRDEQVQAVREVGLEAAYRRLTGAGKGVLAA
jgi:hypothetical protein